MLINKYAKSRDNMFLSRAMPGSHELVSRFLWRIGPLSGWGTGPDAGELFDAAEKMVEKVVA